MAVPQNAQAIYEYLTGHGYNSTAAAGILGNMTQESGGSPEAQGSGGGGLIGWTPESAAQPIQPIITGNVKRDLTAQLQDVLNWNVHMKAGPGFLNKASSPQDAARLYMNQAERPNPALANLANRQQSAVDVANAAKSGNWKAGNPVITTSTGPGSSIGGDIIGAILSGLGLPNMADLMKRLGLILLGGALIIVGIAVLIGKQHIMDIGLAVVPEARAGEAVAGKTARKVAA
jgi:hypothetical protein